MLDTIKKKATLPIVIAISILLLMVNVYCSGASFAKASQVFEFMFSSVKHELVLHDSITSTRMAITRHKLLNAWHIRVGPYRDYKTINSVAKSLADLSYQVKVARNKNNSAYYLLDGNFVDYKSAQKFKNELTTDKYLSEIIN